MSKGNTPSVSVGASAGSRAENRRTATPESRARTGVIKQTIAEATPRQLNTTLSSHEASDDIVQDEDMGQDEVAADETMLEMEAEMDGGDEDRPSMEDWAEDGEFMSGGDEEGEPGINPFASHRFEILVTNGICSVPVDEKCIRSAKTHDGQTILDELESRFWAFRRIAAWLTERRGKFLRTRDLWDLGCEALDDIKSGRIPVEQKSFLICAGLEPRVSEESLSRYIRATGIAWTDGGAPLQILFCSAARMAWVGKAVRQFVEEGREKLTVTMLDKVKAVKVGRGKRAALAHMAPDAMDLPTFIQKANMLAGTQWAEVIAEYGDRITE